MNRIIVIAATLALALIAASASSAGAGTVPAKRHSPVAQNRNQNPLYTHPFSPFRMLRRGDTLPGQEDCRRYRSRVHRSNCEKRNERYEQQKPQKQD